MTARFSTCAWCKRVAASVRSTHFHLSISGKSFPSTRLLEYLCDVKSLSVVRRYDSSVLFCFWYILDGSGWVERALIDFTSIPVSSLSSRRHTVRISSPFSMIPFGIDQLFQR